MLSTTTKRIAMFLTFGLAGCGGAGASSPGASTPDDVDESTGEGAPNTVVHREGSGTVSARLGPPGGSLELVGGPRVEIPPGAVEGGLDFVLKLAQKTTAFFNKESERPLGPTFSLAPDVVAPEGRSITVSFPLGSFPEGWGDPAIAYEISEGEVVGAEDSTRTRWQYERAHLTGGRVVAELPELTGLRMQFVLTNLEAQ